jgi:hypothetical protein
MWRKKQSVCKANLKGKTSRRWVWIEKTPLRTEKMVSPLNNSLALLAKQDGPYVPNMHPRLIPVLANLLSSDFLAVWAGVSSSFELLSTSSRPDACFILTDTMLAQISIAKAVLQNSMLPNIYSENSKFLCVNRQLSASILFELVGEPFILIGNRKSTKKFSDHSPPSQFALEEITDSINSSVSDAFAFADGEQNISQESEALSDGEACSMGSSVRRRGRPRKGQEAPKVKTSVRYCTRNNNAGYKQQILPDTRKARGKATKATPPEVLQITEMQRIGIEDCQIPPGELIVERILQGRPE